MDIHIIFFLLLFEKIFCGYSASDEHHNICFLGEMRNISTLMIDKIPCLEL